MLPAGGSVSLYRVHFTWKKKDRVLRARELDMTHPYFVSIKGLVFTKGSNLIIDPSEDELRHEFGEADHLMIPFQSVALIEELDDKRLEREGKVIPFSLVEESENSSPET
ncbi:MAG: DUF1820 family protein [Alkalispirochaetaceae bacterium]